VARGQGLGRVLIEKTITESRMRGCSLLFLEVRENNHAARSLYHACGFMDVGRRADYYTGASGDRFAAITMQHPLRR
jgi:ribosomal-protein-alanine N-acetyltransferase